MHAPVAVEENRLLRSIPAARVALIERIARAASGANGAQAAHLEAWQLYEIDRVSDPAQIERLQRDLEVTRADVRLAVTDWTAMRKRVREIITRLETDPPPLPAADVSEAGHLLDW